MGEMLELVAWAIFKADYHPEDAANDAQMEKSRREWPQDWAKAERRAKAAVEAMRDPSVTMGDAMLLFLPMEVSRRRAQTAFSAAIDTALGSELQPIGLPAHPEMSGADNVRWALSSAATALCKLDAKYARLVAHVDGVEHVVEFGA